MSRMKSRAGLGNDGKHLWLVLEQSQHIKSIWKEVQGLKHSKVWGISSG